MVQDLLAQPNPADLLNVKFIRDIATINLGSREFSGIDFSATSPVVSAYDGRESGSRLKRVRYRLGWSNETWSVTGLQITPATARTIFTASR